MNGTIAHPPPNTTLTHTQPHVQLTRNDFIDPSPTQVLSINPPKYEGIEGYTTIPLPRRYCCHERSIIAPQRQPLLSDEMNRLQPGVVGRSKSSVHRHSRTFRTPINLAGIELQQVFYDKWKNLPQPKPQHAYNDNKDVEEDGTNDDNQHCVFFQPIKNDGTHPDFYTVYTGEATEHDANYTMRVSTPP